VAADELTQKSDVVLLGVKPNMFGELLPQIAPVCTDDKLVISMAAGISLAYIEEFLGSSQPVIRIMPNTPCSVGYGVILYAFNDLVTISAVESFKMLMSEAGLLDRLTEKLIDAGSAVSGCGPAFAFIFAEALADAGVECGLPRDKALKYAAQMLKGSAELLLQNGNPGVLKDNVCSPGGTTIAGVHALEDSGFRAAAMNAVVAAYKRTLELN
jgi:pyrroline-5-carboxylate reductase